MGRCKEIILGSLLGDGSLTLSKGYVHARFSFRHSVRQKDYFFWKANELKSISGEKSVWEQGRGGQDGWGRAKWRYQSRALPELTEIHHLAVREGKKFIRRKWLNLMTPLSLLVWWLDDGSLVRNSRRGVFCTDGFSLAEVKILRRYLETKWGVISRVGKLGREGKNYFRLWLTSTEELKKFLRMILPQLKVETMLSKVIILYNDSELQERWISEVASLTKFPLEVVKTHLEEKRRRYKRFRE